MKYCVAFIVCMASACLLQAESMAPSSNPDKKQELIDKELKSLYAELQEDRLHSSKEELEAQVYFRNAPGKYMEKVKLDEDDEKRILQIKEKIEHLEKQKESRQK